MIFPVVFGILALALWTAQSWLVVVAFAVACILAVVTE